MVEHVGVTDELIGIRHYLHQHPERSFKEVETSAYLARLLRGHGIDVLDTTLETGVVALIEGEVPGPRIALRADIDGLPITEDTGLPFSSLNPGVMHGCGHDLHMTGLLGAAFWLADHRDRIAGSVKIVFQPAEEVGLGARTVVESDATDDVKAIIGTHNNPNYAPGQIAIGPQPMMAGCVKFKVTLHAQGTHAGYPQKAPAPSRRSLDDPRPADHREPQHLAVPRRGAVHHRSAWRARVERRARRSGIPGHRALLRPGRRTAGPPAFRGGGRAHGRSVRDRGRRGLGLHPGAAGRRRGAVRGGRGRRALLRGAQADTSSMAGEDFVEFSGCGARLVFAFIGSNGEPGCADWHSPHFVGVDGAIGPAVDFYVNASLRVLAELR